MNYLSIHAHFYQPPREDPFSGVIPQEVGAEPYHDWNQRINDECYRPNARLGNYELVGFDLGPTLALWLEKNDPFTYEAIIAADRHNVERHGVGNAIAQAYNHTILPLATQREKEIQIAWGIADFEHRFSRRPAGIWLAETAVDIATLEVLARFGITFTILAPWQALDANIDVTEPYLVRLPSGRAITVLFFDGQLAKSISWNARVSQDAWEFAELCLPMRSNWYKERRDEDQLLLIANDGEYYGHHHRGRERFLNTLLASAAFQRGYKPVYPALYLRDHPPRQEVRIVENTAWSCYHGIARWKESCPCIPTDGTWKTHLRRALDLHSGRIDRLFEEEMERMLGVAGESAWALAQSFIKAVLGQVDEASFVASATGTSFTAEQQTKLRYLLRAQYFRQLMFTSCGFFFEDLSRIEPKNDIAYALKAADLVERATGLDLRSDLLASLALARSSLTGKTGADIAKELTA